MSSLRRLRTQNEHHSSHGQSSLWRQFGTIDRARQINGSDTDGVHLLVGRRGLLGLGCSRVFLYTMKDSTESSRVESGITKLTSGEPQRVVLRASRFGGEFDRAFDVGTDEVDGT